MSETTPASEQPTPIDPSSLLELDVFLDASDSSALDSMMQDSFLGLDHSTTGSSLSTWTENLESEMAWNSTNTFPPILESIPSGYISQAAPLSNTEPEAQSLAFNDTTFPQDTFAIQNLPPLLEENMQIELDADTSAMDSLNLAQSLATFNASDDPFMGWASKRASHLFDDYGWVLSHVEAL